MTGIQLITIGLLGEMVARTYHESQQKPTYTVRSIINVNKKNEGPLV